MLISGSALPSAPDVRNVMQKLDLVKCGSWIASVQIFRLPQKCVQILIKKNYTLHNSEQVDIWWVQKQ
jgi:hypothetical protein